MCVYVCVSVWHWSDDVTYVLIPPSPPALTPQVQRTLTGMTPHGATAQQAGAAAKALLGTARPAYAVYGATAGSASYEAVKNMLK